MESSAERLRFEIEKRKAKSEKRKAKSEKREDRKKQKKQIRLLVNNFIIILL